MPQRQLRLLNGTATNSVDRKYPFAILRSFPPALTSSSLGAAAVTFGLPLLVYTSTFLCNDVSGCPSPALLHPRSLTLEKLKHQTPWPENGIMGLVDGVAIGWVVAYN